VAGGRPIPNSCRGQNENGRFALGRKWRAPLSIPYPAATMTAGILLYAKEAGCPPELHRCSPARGAHVLAKATDIAAGTQRAP